MVKSMHYKENHTLNLNPQNDWYCIRL